MFSLTPPDRYICGLRHLCQFYLTVTSSNESVCLYFHPSNEYSWFNCTETHQSVKFVAMLHREDRQKTIRMTVLNLCTKTR